MNTVLSYDQVADLPSNEPSVIVDFSGNASLQENLQGHLEAQLVYNCLVGMVDWTQRVGLKVLLPMESFSLRLRKL